MRLRFVLAEMGVNSGEGVRWGLAGGSLDVLVLSAKVKVGAGAVFLEDLEEAKGAEGGAVSLTRLLLTFSPSSSSRSALLRFTDADVCISVLGPETEIGGEDSSGPVYLIFAACTPSSSPFNFIPFTAITKSNKCLYTTELNLTSLWVLLTSFRILSTASLSCTSECV